MGRLHALTAAYSLLSSESWQTVTLRNLLLEELKPFLSPERNNIRIAGPTVSLPPRAALALGMAIHELTTNAVKYGALSAPDGVVEVTWRTEAEELILDWRESGGPAITGPNRRGFGTTLIERGLKQDMSATVQVDYAVGGVQAKVRAPLPLGHGAPPE